MLLDLLVLLLAIAVNGFFALAEIAIISARRPRLRLLVEKKAHGARRALALAEDPSRLLSTVQVGITLVGIFAGAYSGAVLAEPLAALLLTVPGLVPVAHELALALVVMGVGSLTLVAGELVPKRLALVHPERIACAVAPVMHGLAVLATPLVILLRLTTEGVLRLCGVSLQRMDTVTEEEVKSMIAEGAESGALQPGERQMLEGVMRLADRTVRGVMTPRPDMVVLDLEQHNEALAQKIIESGYSRFPICRGNPETIIGIVHAKDLLDALLAGQPFAVAASMTVPLVVHDHAPVLRVLEQFRQQGRQMAVVVDEHGALEGLVTLTDITEAIAGFIPDRPETAAEQSAVRRGDGSWLLDGGLPVDEVEAICQLRGMRHSAYHTLAGFVMAQLHRIPRTGDYFTYAGTRFEVVDMDGRRIDKVLVMPPLSLVAPAEPATVPPVPVPASPSSR